MLTSLATLYEAEAANILPLLQDAPVIISVSPIAYKLRS